MTLEKKLSDRVVSMMRRAKQAAIDAVNGHLAAGRSVYGRKNGKPTLIHPERRAD